MTAARRSVIFILGCGRSGTSLLTRLVSFCGAGLPRRMLPADFGNPTGYWEPSMALTINDGFLTRHGSIWEDSTLALMDENVSDTERREFRDSIKACLLGEFDACDVIVVKDPRIPAVIDDWLAAVDELGWNATALHVFRRPQGVIRSLGDPRLDPRHAVALWLKYNLLSAVGARAIPRAFLSFEALTQDWETTLGEALGDLRLDLAAPCEVRELAASFVVPRSPTPDAEPTAMPEFPGGWTARTLAALQSARRAPDDAQRTFDEVFAEFRAADAMFRAGLAGSQHFIALGPPPRAMG